ncbi:MAG: hypothetical protein IKJ04_00115 [Clostridia bacterium]|nr:hypothetical protein [Clostridia bacterium]
MKKEEMNKIIGMLDDDVIADALGEKRAASKGSLNRRKFVTTLIAATLAVAILASTLIIALSRGGSEERVNILPPVGSYVIKNVASGSQITEATEVTRGTYPTVESNQYWTIGDPVPYTNVGGLEMSDELYSQFLASGDANRIWAIEVSVSPNLYLTKDYLATEAERMLAEVSAEQLSSIAEFYEQAKGEIDIDALYFQYKDYYDLFDVYKYIKSGQLDRDLLNTDIDTLKKKVKDLIDYCGDIREDYWQNLEPIVVAELEKCGVPFVKEGDSYVIFVTEGELMALSGIDGLKFEGADIKIAANAFDPNPISDRAGKKVKKRLADAMAAHEGEDVLFAVLVENASSGEIVNKAAYEQKYLSLLADLAARKTVEQALRAAVEGGEKLEYAISLCGKGTVDKYLKDGAFDAELFASDTAAMQVKFDEMKNNLYRDNSYEIYDAFKAQVNYIELNGNGSIIIYVTAAEFDSLTFEGDYVFDLAA